MKCLADKNHPIAISIKKIAAMTIIIAALIAVGVCLKTVLGADYLQPYSPSGRTLVIIASEDAANQSQKPLLSIVSDYLSTDQSRRKPSFLRTPIVSIWVIGMTIGLLSMLFITLEGPTPLRPWIRTFIIITLIMLPVNYYIYKKNVAKYDIAARQVDIETAQGHHMAAVRDVTLFRSGKVQIRTATANITTDYRTITFRDDLAGVIQP